MTWYAVIIDGGFLCFAAVSLLSLLCVQVFPTLVYTDFGQIPQHFDADFIIVPGRSQTSAICMHLIRHTYRNYLIHATIDTVRCMLDPQL